MIKLFDGLSAEQWGEKFLGVGGKLLSALLILIIGYIVMRILVKIIRKAVGRTKLDSIVQGYLVTCIKALIWIIIIVSLLSALGVPTTSLIALLSAAGAAIALALQNSLSNLAGGILIIINKPFQQGDLIEAQGITGVVEEIHLWNCRLHTPGNNDIIIPNGSLFNGNIVNCTANVWRRVEVKVGVAYGTDLALAREVLLGIAKDSPLIDDKQPVVVGVKELADSAITLDFMAWAKSTDYWPVYYYMNEEAAKRLPAAGVTIPFPQLDVHLADQPA